MTLKTFKTKAISIYKATTSIKGKKMSSLATIKHLQTKNFLNSMKTILLLIYVKVKMKNSHLDF